MFLVTGLVPARCHLVSSSLGQHSNRSRVQAEAEGFWRLVRWPCCWHSHSCSLNTKVIRADHCMPCLCDVLQVCVPKNTVLVVTREKGGFLSVLQSSLSTGAEPDPRLAEVRRMHELGSVADLVAADKWRGAAGSMFGWWQQCWQLNVVHAQLEDRCGMLCMHYHLQDEEGGDHCSCCVVLLQVSTCLASIAQGVHTKSRAWVARPQASQVRLHLCLHLCLQKPS